MLQKQLVLYVDTFALLWECFSFSFSFSFNQFFFHKEKYFKQSCIENENLHFMFNGLFLGGGGNSSRFGENVKKNEKPGRPQRKM